LADNERHSCIFIAAHLSKVLPIDLHNDIRCYYNQAETSDCLNDICLGTAGCIDNAIQICQCCLESLNHHKMPKFAISNGNYIGPTPEIISSLSRTEETMISFAHPQIYISKIRGGENLRLNSHSYSLRSEDSPIVAKIPKDILSMQSIKVSIIGNLSHSQTKKITQLYNVRISNIVEAYNWLRQDNHNSLYTRFKDQHLNLESLNKDIRIINQSVIEHEPMNEKTILDNLDRFNQPIVDNNQYACSENDLELCRSSVITNNDPHQISYLQVEKSTIFLKEYDPNYWTESFIKLFAYGRGGNNESRAIPLTTHQFIGRLFRLTSNAFRTHHTLWATSYDLLSRRSGSQV